MSNKLANKFSLLTVSGAYYIALLKYSQLSKKKKYFIFCVKKKNDFQL